MGFFFRQQSLFSLHFYDKNPVQAGLTNTLMDAAQPCPAELCRRQTPVQTAQLSRTRLRPRGPRARPPAFRPPPRSPGLPGFLPPTLPPRSSLACFEIAPPAGAFCVLPRPRPPHPSDSEVMGQRCLPPNPTSPLWARLPVGVGLGLEKTCLGASGASASCRLT